MGKFNRLKLLLLLVGVVVAVVLVWLAVRQFGLIGTLLVPAAAVGGVIGAAAKTVGAKPIPKNDTGRPRRPGTSAVSPMPKPGERRARPRRNNWR